MAAKSELVLPQSVVDQAVAEKTQNRFSDSRDIIGLAGFMTGGLGGALVSGGNPFAAAGGATLGVIAMNRVSAHIDTRVIAMEQIAEAFPEATRGERRRLRRVLRAEINAAQSQQTAARRGKRNKVSLAA